MKTVCFLLVIAAVCCFAPVMSNVIRDGKDEQGSVAELSCLQKAMKTDEKAVEGVIEFVCAYVKFKDIPDKEVLINEIQKLEGVTNCTTEDIFGTSESLERIVMDENDVLRHQITIMAQLLKLRGVPPRSVEYICVFLPDNVMSTDSVTQTRKGEDGQGNKRTTRDILKLLGGLTGGSDGLGGLLSPVNTVTGLLGGLLGGLPGGLLGGGQKQGDLLGNLLGGLGRQKAACGLSGSTGQGTQGLGGLTGGVTDLISGLLNSQGGGLGGTIGGLTNGLGGLTGTLGQLTQGLGGLPGGLLGGGGIGNLLGR